MDNCGDKFESEIANHGESDFADHVACMRCHNSCADNLIRACFGMDFYKPFILSVNYSPVHISELAYKGVNFYAFGFRIPFIDANMGNFRVCVSAPWDGQGA